MSAGRRRQATPVELAALLVESVCVPAAGEAEVVAHLAATLELPPEALGEELLYLRAFAVDFAVLMTLGDAPAKDQILSRYYAHWNRIDEQSGGTLAALEERLGDYAAAIGQAQGQAGLAAQVGRALAERCGLDPAPPQLAVLGARLFAAVYEEVTAMLTEVEIVLLES